MRWRHVDDGLPEPGWSEGLPIFETVLVYAESIDRFALATCENWGASPRWVFRHIREMNLVDFDGAAARIFGDGALITHWARLTRPGGRRRP